MEIEKTVRLPVDVKVLNSAPISFKYRAKGELLIVITKKSGSDS